YLSRSCRDLRLLLFKLPGARNLAHIAAGRLIGGSLCQHRQTAGGKGRAETAEGLRRAAGIKADIGTRQRSPGFHSRYQLAEADAKSALGLRLERHVDGLRPEVEHARRG